FSYDGSVQTSLVTGILPNEEKKVSAVADKMVKGSLTDFQPDKFGIVLGESLANLLAVNTGDKVTLVTPQVSLTPAGVIPRFKRFTVIGIFSAGGGSGLDRALG